MLKSGQTPQFAATNGATQDQVRWICSHGIISPGGLFTAPDVLSDTRVTITATDIAHASVVAQVQATIHPLVQVAISPASASVASSGILQLVATVAGASNAEVLWSTDIGTVWQTGMFTAPVVVTSAIAKVVVTSRADPTVYAVAQISVSVAQPIAVTVPPMTAELFSGESLLFKASVSGTNVTGVTWSSDAGSIDQNGYFTAPEVSSQTAVSVRATSQADTTKSGVAVVIVAVTTPFPPAQPVQSDGPAELPRSYVKSSIVDTPVTGITTIVSDSASFQSALDNSNCGDTISLSTSGRFQGRFTFPSKPCDDANWILIRSAAPDSVLPPEHSRILPCYSGMSMLAGRPSFQCPAGTQSTTAGITGTIVFAPGANHYRLLGLEITRAAGTGVVYNLVNTDERRTSFWIVSGCMVLQLTRPLEASTWGHQIT